LLKEILENALYIEKQIIIFVIIKRNKYFLKINFITQKTQLLIL